MELDILSDLTVPQTRSKMDEKQQNYSQIYNFMCGCLMKTQLLKFGDGGKFAKPGFRDFWLDPDLTAMHWRSKKRGTSKSGGEKSVLFKDVSEIVFQQKTEKFRNLESIAMRNNQNRYALADHRQPSQPRQRLQPQPVPDRVVFNEGWKNGHAL